MTFTRNPQSRQAYGVCAGVISAASYGAMSFVVHSYGVRLPSTEVIFCRSFVALIALGPFAFRDRKALASRDAGTLWLRSLLGAVSILCFTWNLQHTSIGLSNVLFNLATLGVLLLAWISKSERLSPIRTVCLLLVIGGSFVFWGDSSIGGTARVLTVGIGGAFAAATSYAALKRAAARWSPMTLTWGISFLSIPVTLLLKKGSWGALTHDNLLPLILIATLCTIGQLFVALSYKWAALSTATAVASSTMAFGIVIDALCGDPAGGRQLVGCAIYLAGCIPLTVIKEDS